MLAWGLVLCFLSLILKGISVKSQNIEIAKTHFIDNFASCFVLIAFSKKKKIYLNYTYTQNQK